jgi:hypothetical protein
MRIESNSIYTSIYPTTINRIPYVEAFPVQHDLINLDVDAMMIARAWAAELWAYIVNYYYTIINYLWEWLT